MSKPQLDFNVLSRSLGYYGAKENSLREKWRKRLNSFDSAQFELISVVSEFLDDLSTPAELFFMSGELR